MMLASGAVSADECLLASDLPLAVLSKTDATCLCFDSPLTESLYSTGLQVSCCVVRLLTRAPVGSVLLKTGWADMFVMLCGFDVGHGACLRSRTERGTRADWGCGQSIGAAWSSSEPQLF